MFSKILGTGDLLCAAMLLVTTALFPQKLIVYGSGFLVFKGSFFTFMHPNVPSALDILCGIYLLLWSFGIGHGLITIFFVAFLVQKGVASFL